MALTAAGLPPVAQMQKKRKGRAPDTCTKCGAPGHRSSSSICPLKTRSKIFEAVVPRSPSTALSSLNFSDHCFALVTEVVTFCPGLLALVKQMTPGYAPRGAWEGCMLIAPRDEHLELLDEHSIAVLTHEAAQELYEDAYSGDMSPNQLVTGIDFVDEGQTVTRPWVFPASGRKSCGYRAPMYLKDETRLRFVVLDTREPEVEEVVRGIERKIVEMTKGRGGGNLNAGGGGGGSAGQGSANDFGIVYTNEHVGERKRKLSQCSRCVSAGKPDTVSIGHIASNVHCPSR